MIAAKKKETKSGISAAMQQLLRDYFACHEGHMPVTGLYEMVIGEVEKPLLQLTLDYVGGNQTRAAELLGINRNTLRKKIKQCGMA